MKLVLLLLVIITVLKTSNAQVYERLMSDLTSSPYNAAQPPSHKNATEVSFSLTLSSIESLDEFAGTFAGTAWEKLLWTDPRLAWNPEDYDGITIIRMPVEKVWIPDIMPYNSVIPQQRIHEVHLLIYSGGTLFYILPVSLKTSCAMKFADYPYDTQTCEIKWGSWVHDDSSISLTSAASDVDFEAFGENPTWELVDSSAVSNKIKYPCCAETYRDVTVSITMKRRHPESLIATSVIASWMILVVFVVLPSSGERVIFSGFIFISLVYLSASLNTTIPASTSTRLGRYLVFGLILTAIITVVNAVCYSLYPRQVLETQKGDPPSTQDLLVERRRRYFRIFDVVALIVTFLLLVIITGALFAL